MIDKIFLVFKERLMKKQKLILLAVLTFYVSVTHSEDLPRYTRHFICSSYEDARKCAGSCRQVQNPYELEFKVETKSNRVTVITYEKDKVVGISSLKECGILNRDNWSCDDYSPTGSKEAMMNGQYVAYSFGPIKGFSCSKQRN